MVTLKTFEGVEQFVSENETDFTDNYLVFKQLLSLLAEINLGKIQDYKLFNIIENTTTKIICLQTKQYLLLIPNKQEISSVSYGLLKSKFYPMIIEGAEILGERNLVLNIIKDCNVKFDIIKDRLFWECKKTKPILRCEGSLQIPLMKDIDEITRMEMDYHKEEYGTKSNCDFQETKVLVEKKIKKESILLWKNKNEIVSLINANIEGDLFYVYHIFTKQAQRRKGFASNLLYSVASKLIDSEDVKVGLVSQRFDNVPNKIFKEIGFESVFEMLDITVLEKRIKL